MEKENASEKTYCHVATWIDLKECTLCHVATSTPLMSQHHNPPWSSFSIMSQHELSSCRDINCLHVAT